MNSFPQDHAIECRLERLVTLIVSLVSGNEQTMVWIGSGLSMGCGYPGWQAAVEQLCKVCISGKSDIGPSAVGHDLLAWAERCKVENPEKYFETLANLFGTKPGYIRAAYSHICACPFRYLITTNFDSCLET